jgi:dipeptidyl aminopeptidase/acylaminoacyl peptidase
MEFDLASALAARSKRSKPPYGETVRGNEWAAKVAPTYLKQLLTGSEKDLNTARYSPDGKSLAIVYANRTKMFAPTEFGLRKNRYLGKIAVLQISTGRMKTIADYPEGLRGPICWSPDGREILFSRYLPKGDDREKMEGKHGLGIWAIDRDGGEARFVTTGWSPDWR